MLERTFASGRAVGWESTNSIPKISWLSHTPLPLQFSTPNRYVVFILDRVCIEHSQESSPYCFPEHSFQTTSKPKIVSVLSLKKKLWSFPCMHNVFILSLVNYFHMLSTRPTDSAESPYPHAWNDLSPRGSVPKRQHGPTALCASLPMRLWIIVGNCWGKWVVANYWCGLNPSNKWMQERALTFYSALRWMRLAVLADAKTFTVTNRAWNPKGIRQLSV